MGEDSTSVSPGQGPEAQHSHLPLGKEGNRGTWVTDPPGVGQAELPDWHQQQRAEKARAGGITAAHRRGGSRQGPLAKQTLIPHVSPRPSSPHRPQFSE